MSIDYLQNIEKNIHEDETTYYRRSRNSFPWHPWMPGKENLQSEGGMAE
jgi:hypothetical protein